MKKKYKIGIYTWALSRNYGSCLQAYSLQKYIDSIGYDAYIFLPYVKNSSPIVNVGRTVKRAFDVISRKYFGRRYFELNPEYSTFFNNYYKLHLSLSTYDKEKFDIFMTGSDQLWNPNYLYEGESFLEFVDKQPKFAYSTSIGVNSIPDGLKDLYIKNISKFQCVGMREEMAVLSVKKLLENNKKRIRVTKVLDPTFLIRPNEWRELSEKANVRFEIPSDYIFCYLLGEKDEYHELLRLIWQQSKIKNLIIVQSAENPNFKLGGAISYKDAGPLEFVKLLLAARLVVTDSFHCTAISINNNINFYEFLRFDDKDSLSQNSRIYELLNDFGLNDRLLNGLHDVSHIKNNFIRCNMNIDYSISNDLLEKYRKNSEDFLNKALARAVKTVENKMGR